HRPRRQLPEFLEEDRGSPASLRCAGLQRKRHDQNQCGSTAVERRCKTVRALYRLRLPARHPAAGGDEAEARSAVEEREGQGAVARACWACCAPPGASALLAWPPMRRAFATSRGSKTGWRWPPSAFVSTILTTSSSLPHPDFATR